MITTWHQYRHAPVVSYQDSDLAGQIAQAIVNPSDLRICALLCNTASARQRQLLLPSDVLHVDQRQVIINSATDLIAPHEIWRLQPLLKLNYSPLRKGVYTESGKRLGIVYDFSFETENWYIHKLHVRPGLFGTVRRDQPFIDRRQIIEITTHKIVVQDTKSLAPHLMTRPFGLGANQNPS